MNVKTILPTLLFALLGYVLIACGGKAVNPAETSQSPIRQGTYEILATGTVPSGIRDFHAQDLSAAREESSGVLRMAYEGALARFEEKHGRKPEDDLETAAAICDWVAYHLRHPYFWPDDLSLPRFYPQTADPEYDNYLRDPIKIIQYTMKFDPNDPVSWPSPMCTQQNLAAAGIMNYAGLHARLCYVENHDGLEYYSWKFKKWIWMDSTFNEHFSLHLEGGTVLPLGAKELQELTLFGGIQDVQMVKHGYPDGTNPDFNYLDVHPHGFRRYAPFFYMKTLNGFGSNVSSKHIFTSCLPIPESYLPATNEFTKLELDPSSNFSRLSCVQDPLLLDVPLDALTLGDFVSQHRDGFVINLQTWLPHASRFEIQYGDGAPWQLLELVHSPTGTPKASSGFVVPWNPGVISFRSKDNAGNSSETLTIRLETSSTEVPTTKSPATGVLITPDKQSPQYAGNATLFIADGLGSSGYQYRFWLHNGTNWSLEQDYGVGFSWTMPPSTPVGSYTIAVDVRTSTAVDRDAVAYLPYKVQAAPATDVTLYSNQSSPQPKGTPVLYTANGFGSSGYQYRFWLYNGATWSMVQDYGANSTWTLPASTPAGNYTIAVETRTSKSVDRDAVTYLPYQITP